MRSPALPSKHAARWLAPALAIAVAVLAQACGNSASSTTTSDPVITTETFSGSLAMAGYATRPFQVTQAGLVTATLTSLAPQTTMTVGFGIGQPSGTTCAIVSGTESARVGSVLSGTAGIGTYCLTIYDIGNSQGPNDFVITLTHP